MVCLLTGIGSRCFYRCVAEIKKTDFVQKEEEKVEKKPVVFWDFREWLTLLTQFVAVGGDFV